MIIFANTIVYPLAMMIKFIYTSIANITVSRIIGKYGFTCWA